MWDYLIFISINLFAKSANIVVGNAIRGSGNTIWMLITQLFGTLWVVSVALLFVFVLKLGIAGGNGRECQTVWRACSRDCENATAGWL